MYTYDTHHTQKQTHAQIHKHAHTHKHTLIHSSHQCQISPSLSLMFEYANTLMHTQHTQIQNNYCCLVTLNSTCVYVCV